MDSAQEQWRRAHRLESGDSGQKDKSKSEREGLKKVVRLAMMDGLRWWQWQKYMRPSWRWHSWRCYVFGDKDKVEMVCILNFIYTDSPIDTQCLIYRRDLFLLKMQYYLIWSATMFYSSRVCVIGKASRSFCHSAVLFPLTGPVSSDK